MSANQHKSSLCLQRRPISQIVAEPSALSSSAHKPGCRSKKLSCCSSGRALDSLLSPKEVLNTLSLPIPTRRPSPIHEPISHLP